MVVGGSLTVVGSWPSVMEGLFFFFTGLAGANPLERHRMKQDIYTFYNTPSMLWTLACLCCVWCVLVQWNLVEDAVMFLC